MFKSIGIVLMIFLFIWVGKMESEDQQAQLDRYCGLVLIWKNSDGKHGHPDYNRIYKEECER
jgi:hypothetical protein